MVTGYALAAALAVGALYYGGKELTVHVVKPTACFVKKVGTLGHKHCQPKQKKPPQK